MHKTAVLDKLKKFRYSLTRQWGPDASNLVNFILLNPSTADAEHDDPTVKACIAFAKKCKFDALAITNLFAFRATNPKKIKSCEKPNGPKNDKYIKDAAKKSKLVVVAWGNHGVHCNRNKEVLKILRAIKRPRCLGKTVSGHPKHPLYVKRTTRPILY